LSTRDAADELLCVVDSGEEDEDDRLLFIKTVWWAGSWVASWAAAGVELGKKTPFYRGP
jgi:serine protease inhibitor